MASQEHNRTTLRAVLLAAIMALSMVAMGAAGFAGTAVADVPEEVEEIEVDTAENLIDFTEEVDLDELLDNEFDVDAGILGPDENSIVADTGIENTDQDLVYETIQDAVDDAEEGETIELAAGATFEDDDIRLNTDNITLTSADAEDPAEIQSGDDDGDILKVDNDGVTVSDVDITVTIDGQGAIDDSGGGEFTLDSSTVSY